MKSKPNKKFLNHFYKVWRNCKLLPSIYWRRSITQNISNIWFKILYVHDKNVFLSKSLKGLWNFTAVKVLEFLVNHYTKRENVACAIYFLFKISDSKYILSYMIILIMKSWFGNSPFVYRTGRCTSIAQLCGMIWSSDFNWRSSSISKIDS